MANIEQCTPCWYINYNMVSHVEDEGRRDIVAAVSKIPIKVLYRCMESTILWYEIYNNKLDGMDFKLNLYERCVANNMVNG